MSDHALIADPGAWARASRLLDDLLDLPASRRGPTLDEACAGDQGLRRYLEALLAADAKSGHLLDSPAAEGFPDLVVGTGVEAPGDDEADPYTGQRIGPWRLLRPLGRGGMGAVFLAERDDGQFEQQAALKVVKQGMDTEEVLRRFLAERQILAHLQHPNIARLLDGGVTDDGRPYFAMEYVEGTPLVAYSVDRGLALQARLRLVEGVCDAVQYAHRNLVVHRDLKPSNILVTADGRPKLLDFGIAKLLSREEGLTGADERVMTPEYAAPEQMEGKPVTTATDVFAVGLLLYEMVAGRRWKRARPGDEPRVGQGDLDAILETALRDEPESRYASVEALATDIRRFLSGFPVLSRKANALYRARKFVRRHRVGVGAAAVTLLALLAGLGGTLWQARLAAAQARLAAAQEAKTAAVKDFLVSVFEVSDPDKAQGERITARELLDRGAGRIEQELGGQPEIAGELLALVGTLHLRLGAHERAAPLVERGLALQRQVHGEGSSPVADSLGRLADVRNAGGDFEGAERLWREAFAIHSRRLGPAHPATVNDADALAQVLLARGRNEEARALIDDTLEQIRRQRGEENENYANTLNTLQMLHWAKGEYVEAEPVMRRALEIYRRLFGDRHTRVAEGYSNLGTLALTRGDAAEAEAMFRRALDIQTTLYGSEHPGIWITLNNLAKAVQERGGLEEAVALQRRALALRTAQLGQDNPQLGVNLHNLALLLRERGEYEEATRLLRETVAMNSKLLGDEHVSQLIALGSLALVLSESGKEREAEVLFRRSLESFRKKGLEKHLKFPDLAEGLGMLLVTTGRAGEAEGLLRAALEHRRNAMGENSWRTAGAKANLARCLQAMGRRPEARALAADAQPVLSRLRGDQHPLTRVARAVLDQR